jgi:hypothetical protein
LRLRFGGLTLEIGNPALRICKSVLQNQGALSQQVRCGGILGNFASNELLGF